MKPPYSLASLKQKFKGKITTNEATLEQYSRDASIFEIHPKIIMTPEDVQDLKTVVEFVAHEKIHSPNLSITVRGGGQDTTGGSLNDSIIVDTAEHLNSTTNLTSHSVETEAGVKLSELEPRLIAQNTMIPAFPSGQEGTTVGGIAANNSGGEKSLSYGQANKFISELDVIFADGNLYKVKPLNESELKTKIEQTNFEGEIYKKVYNLIQNNYRAIQEAKPTTTKNTSGFNLWDVWDGKIFDLTKLIVGSQGTLGIIAKIKWNLAPIQRGRQLVIFYLNNLNQLGEIVNHINELNPESFEMFDQQTFALAIKNWPTLMKKMKGSSWKIFKQSLPDFWNWTNGNLPKLILLAEFTADTQDQAFNKARQAAHNISEHFNLQVRLSKNYEESQKYWIIRRRAQHLLDKHTARKISAAFIEDIAIHPEQLPTFIPQLEKILSKYPDFTYTLTGHVGDANLHIIPTVNLSIPEHRRQLVWLSNEVFDLVLKHKGTISAEHNDGLVRGPFLEHMFGQKIFGLFKEVKQIFDPQNIFNPHKKIDADLDFYTKHIRVN